MVSDSLAGDVVLVFGGWRRFVEERKRGSQVGGERELTRE